MRVPDATWFGVLVLLVLQSSFLLPPFGAALMLARASLRTGAALSATIAALAPFLLVQVVVLATTLAVPRLTHLLEPSTPAASASSTPSAAEVEQRLRQMMGGGAGGLPPVPPLTTPR